MSILEHELRDVPSFSIGLAVKLLDISRDDEDGAHDLSHIVRVWRNAKLIHMEEGGDLEVLLCGRSKLHDCVQVAKGIPLCAAGRHCWQRTKRVFASKHLGGEPSRIDTVAYATESHSFSGAVAPKSIEGCILQDADRLDAIGLSGIARCFYTAGRLGSRLYDLADPLANTRPLDDGRNALDHFPKKLLTLNGSFKTRKGEELAQERHRRLHEFYRAMLSEVQE